MVPDKLCNFARDAYIVAKYGDRSDGRLFEDALAEIAHLIGFHYVQGSGSLDLFGTPAASNLRHELDLAMAAPGLVGIVEAKDRRDGIGKNDVMLFLHKTFDYCLGKLAEGRRDPTWRFLVSATPVDHNLLVFCIQHGLIVVDPKFLPLPMLLRFVARPTSERLFDDVQLGEAVRLFEPACLPIERIFVPEGNKMEISTDRFFGNDANDAQWLANRMSEEILREIQNCGRQDPLWQRAKTLRRSGSRALSLLLPQEVPQ